MYSYLSWGMFAEVLKRIISIRVVEGIIGWLIENLSLHGYFPFKFDCKRSQGVAHTYLRLFK